MIIELVLKNWMSFRDESVFSMVTEGEKRFLKRVPQVRSKPVLNVNPVAVLYGGNASGKSNLLSVFDFLKKLVLQPIHNQDLNLPLQQYALGPALESERPTMIDLTFLTADNQIFFLHLVLNKEKVQEESLAIVKPNKNDMLYERHGNKVELSELLQQDEKAQAFQKIVRQNQLFLAIACPEVESLKSVSQWFSKQLRILNTNADFSMNERWYLDDSRRQKIGELLEKLDTGVCSLKLDKIPMKNQDDLQKIAQMTNMKFMYGFVRKEKRIYKNNQNEIEELVSFHRGEDGKEHRFELGMEAEGTVRLLDILPVFLELEDKTEKPVYIIDELDRNWHYLLSRQLLSSYIKGCSKQSRSQLLFSTHDLMLMDQSLFRRSEIFVTERSQEGISSVFSLNIPGLRYDKDIRKYYLQGVLGGIPCLRHYGLLTD